MDNLTPQEISQDNSKKISQEITQEITQENNKTEVPEKNFQFYKAQLQEDVREYLTLDDQIAALNKALKERRDKKKKVI